MGLLNWLRPGWRHSDSDVRMRTVKELEDPVVLVDVILGDGEWFVRHEAFARLRRLGPDQDHYHRLMRESDDEEIRRKAVKVMTDEAELQRAAETDPYRYVRDAAEHRLEEVRTGRWGDSA